VQFDQYLLGISIARQAHRFDLAQSYAEQAEQLIDRTGFDVNGLRIRRIVYEQLKTAVAEGVKQDLSQLAKDVIERENRGPLSQPVRLAYANLILSRGADTFSSSSERAVWNYAFASGEVDEFDADFQQEVLRLKLLQPHIAPPLISERDIQSARDT